MITCDYTKEKILSGELTDSVKEHIATCRNCAALSEEWNALRNVRPAEKGPSEELDRSICSTAAIFAAARKAKNVPKPHHRSLNFWIPAVAALFLVSLTGIFYNVEFAVRPAPIEPATTAQTAAVGNTIWSNTSEIDETMLDLAMDLNTMDDAIAVTETVSSLVAQEYRY